jgi:hypothetical protein
MPVPVALIRSGITALTISSAAQRVGFGTREGVNERRQQLAQHVGKSGRESLGQHLGPVDIVGSGHRVGFFARVTLDGLSKNHAMTSIYPATTTPALSSRRVEPRRIAVSRQGCPVSLHPKGTGTFLFR